MKIANVARTKTTTANPILRIMLILGILVQTFSCSSGDDNGSNPQGTSQVCGSISYDPNIHRCEQGELIGKCMGKDYYPAYQSCVGGEIISEAEITQPSSSSTEAKPNQSSSSGGSQSSSSGSNTLTLYCDYGDLPYTDGGGCIQINNVNECKEHGIVTTSCGRTGMKYCDWGPINAQYGGGCYPLETEEHCIETSGDIVDICPKTSLRPDCSSETQSNKIEGTPVTYESQEYKTVVIDGQTWMAKNLNYDPGTGNSVCYNNDDANCVTYGRLYDFETAMEVCPNGWHLPTDAEWATLMSFIDCLAAGTIKATEGWNSNGNGTDNYGFAALPGGYGNFEYGNFDHAGSVGNWWSSDEINANSAYSREMYYSMNSAKRAINIKTRLFSVRCLKD